VLLSMTGFASKSESINTSSPQNISMFIEIKSVNSKFFEVICKLPSALSTLEIPLINHLKKILYRGKVYITIRLDKGIENFEKIAPSLGVAEGYISAIEKIQQTHALPGELSIQSLLQLPDIFIIKKNVLTSEQEKAILQTVEQTTTKLIQTRQEEGMVLLKDLQKRLYLCNEKIYKVEKLSEKLMITVKKKINKTLLLVEKEDAFAKLQLDDLYATLNKIDVHEEIIRFKGHLQSIDTLIKENIVEKGKRLDFILQELLRETNTTMAKCNDLVIGSACVDIKVELEKSREQAQNIL
jgi:uncharacterized protein (TIGR00255 family)